MSKSIREKLDYLRELPFPQWADNEALSNWQSELAELDGYVAGLAATALGGERPDASTLVGDLRLAREGLEAIGELSASDREILDACSNYLVALETLSHAILEG